MPEPTTTPTLLTAERLAEIAQTQALDGEDCHCPHCRAVDDLLAHIRAQDERIAALRQAREAVQLCLDFDQMSVAQWWKKYGKRPSYEDHILRIEKLEAALATIEAALGEEG